MQEKAQQPDLPAYTAGEKAVAIGMEKESSFTRDSREHGIASQTPFLDKQLARPNARAALLSLSSAFAAAAEEDRCLKDIVDGTKPDLSAWMQDLKQQKKNGEISKDDKKEFKREMKWLFKGYKKEAKAAWKDKA